MKIFLLNYVFSTRRLSNSKIYKPLLRNSHLTVYDILLYLPYTISFAKSKPSVVAGYRINCRGSISRKPQIPVPITATRRDLRSTGTLIQ